MRVLKIVIADTDPSFCKLLAGNICFKNSLEILGVSSDGEKAVQLIRERKPNVLVMNPKVKNSAVLLSYIQESGGRLKTLAFSQTRRLFIVPLSSEWDSGPCGAPAADLSGYMEAILELAATEQNNALELRISALMRQLGVPAHLKGYQYLRKAIILALEDPSVMEGVTKILYPDIAKYYGTKAGCVERAMRKAIEVAWDRGNVDFLQHYFGYTIKPEMGKPTNSEFIATVADILRLQQDYPEPLASA